MSRPRSPWPAYAVIVAGALAVYGVALTASHITTPSCGSDAECFSLCRAANPQSDCLPFTTESNTP